MIVVERAVRFEEVDAAAMLFFGRYFNYCHDAMARMFDGVTGGYVELITNRRIGLPAVHVAADFKKPLRYGDVVLVEASCARIGVTSATLRYVMRRQRDGEVAATIEHVVVAMSLDTMTKLPLPADMRVILEAHLTA